MEGQVFILLDVLLATVFTGLIGLEREKAGKPAGFRTNMIVGGSSCLMVSLTVVLFGVFNDSVPESVIRTDPIRV